MRNRFVQPLLPTATCLLCSLLISGCGNEKDVTEVTSKVGSTATPSTPSAPSAQVSQQPAEIEEETKDQSGATVTEPNRRSISKHIEQMDALDQMVIAFEGNHSRAEIQSILDHALQLHGRKATNENRERAGSTLVALRKEYDIPEMTILKHMVQIYNPNLNLDFPQAAAIAVVSLQEGR